MKLKKYRLAVQITPNVNLSKMLAEKKKCEENQTEKMLNEKERQTLKAIWHGL
jgi:hypothetical protein